VIRRNSKQIFVGTTPVGGLAPVTVQTMTKTRTSDSKATIAEIKRLALCGCDIIRLAVPDMDAAHALKAITEDSPIPVIADIHFDHLLALAAVEMGADALRLNPGNIRSQDKIREVAAACKDKGIPIRVGVNAGSLDPEIAAKHGGVTPEALAESALRETAFLEACNFSMIKIAVKAFDIDIMRQAAKIVAERTPYPMHLGVTESGLPEEGIIRSSIGIGSLLLDGIGDTIRVSLTGDSAAEIETGINILKATGLRESGPVIVSCPTCGRTQVPLIEMANEVKKALKGLTANIRVAVMGCAVNGPGEAAQADYGIAGAKDSGLIFKKGKILKTLKSSELVEALVEEIRKEHTF